MVKKIIVKGDTAVCALPECGKVFKKKSHNSKYCCYEHTRIAANRRILKRYHEMRKLPKKGRVCKSKDCNTILSVYNRNEYCLLCMDKKGML